MKVDIRHTRHWDLENKRPRGVDGYQQFTCPLERIQSRKRGLSRLQNLLYYSPEMKVFDHHPQLEIFAWCFQTSSALRASNSREPLWIEPGWDCFHEAHTWCGIVRCFTFSDHLITSLYSWLSKNRVYHGLHVCLTPPSDESCGFISPLTTVLKLWEI